METMTAAFIHKFPRVTPELFVDLSQFIPFMSVSDIMSFPASLIINDSVWVTDPWSVYSDPSSCDDANGLLVALQIDGHPWPQLRDEVTAEKGLCETPPAVECGGWCPHVATVLSQFHPPTPALPPNQPFSATDVSTGQRPVHWFPALDILAASLCQMLVWVHLDTRQINGKTKIHDYRNSSTQQEWIYIFNSYAVAFTVTRSQLQFNTYWRRKVLSKSITLMFILLS